MLEPRRGKAYCGWVPMSGQFVDHGAAGISQCQQLGHFVECFARGVVASMTDILIRPATLSLLCEIKMSMAARNHQRQHWETQLAVAFLPLFQQDGVDVAFEMIYRDQRFVQCERQCLG